MRSVIDLTLRVKLTQYWESNWLNIETQIGSTMRLKLTQHWESNWLNIESQIDSTLRVKLTQHWESNWLKYSPVTHFAFWPKKFGQILVPPVTQLFRSKWLNFSIGALRENFESFYPKKLSQILIPPVTQLLGSKWLIYFSRCTER